MLHYFLHSNQHAHTHPNKLYLNPHQLGFATQLQITPLSFPELRDFARVWSYSLAHHSVHFLDQQRHLLSNLSNLPSSIQENPSKSVPGSLTAPVQEQFLSGWRSENTQEDGEKTCGGQGSRKQGKKNTGRIKGGQKESGVSKYEVPIRKKKKWELPLSKYNFRL